MIIFGASKKLESLKNKVGNLDMKLLNSFENVKYDTYNIYQWIDYLNAVIVNQNKTIEVHSLNINNLQIAMKNVPVNKEDIRKIIDEYYSIQPLAAKISELIERVEALEIYSAKEDQIDAIKNRIKQLIDDYPLVVEALDDLKVRVDVIENKRMPQAKMPAYARQRTAKQYTRPRLQEKIIKSVARSSKEYVKNMILTLIQKYEDISALKIREIVVEEQGIVSKSSFYRMLEELEKESKIGMVRVGKEKHYHALKIVKKSI